MVKAHNFLRYILELKMSQSLEKVCKDLEIASKELKLSLQKTRAESKRLQESVRRYNDKVARGNKLNLEKQDTSTPGKDLKLTARGDNGLKFKTGSTRGAYRVRLACEFFTEEELRDGIISPQKVSNRAPFSSDKVIVIKNLVEERFSGKWEEARRAINQKGRDLKKFSNVEGLQCVENAI